MFGEVRLTPRLARLMGTEFEPAVRKELPMMREVPEVSGFSQDRQRQYGADLWQGPQSLIIGVSL